MSSLPAVRSTRKVRTCPALRPLSSPSPCVESSFRMTLFSVTTGDFRMSQTLKLLIFASLLFGHFRGRFLGFCLLRGLFRGGLRSSFLLRLRFLLHRGLFFSRFLLRPRCLLRLLFDCRCRCFCLFLRSLTLRVEQSVQLFDRRLRDEQLFVIKDVVDVQPKAVRHLCLFHVPRGE